MQYFVYYEYSSFDGRDIEVKYGLEAFDTEAEAERFLVAIQDLAGEPENLTYKLIEGVEKHQGTDL